MTKNAKRRQDPLSKHRIIDAAIFILDNKGEDALTFRALAEHLSTGAGALYYHIANKEQLLSAATNSVITTHLSGVKATQDPSSTIRDVSIALWNAAEAHVWIGSNILSESSRLSVANIYEAIGSQLAALNVPLEAQFNVCSSIGSYIIGNISQQSANARQAINLGLQGYSRESYLKEFTQSWRELDPHNYTFVHQILEQFPTHDDKAQYLAGIDLLLAGILKSYSR